MFPFIRYRYFFITLSLLAVGASFILMGTRGLNLGVDFKGGFKMQYQFKNEITEESLRTLLDPAVFGHYVIVRLGDPKERRFTFSFEQSDSITTEEFSKKVQARLSQNISADQITLEQEESVGPKAGKELRRKGQLA
ncbi:MAG: hypothetical protein Q7S00_00715, partial [bacterium]|nr:hypothetical protein [bacterium]